MIWAPERLAVFDGLPSQAKRATREVKDQMADVGTTGRCDLCDLPIGQCIHTRSNSKGARSGARDKRLRPAGGRLGRQSRKLNQSRAPKKAGRKKCVRCGERRRHGQYQICAECLIQKGGVRCRQCGRPFMPNATTSKRKPKCRGCRFPSNSNGRRGRSVWIVASAGAPTLGRRR